MATEKEQAEMEFSGHRTRGSAVNMERVNACCGTQKGHGTCLVTGETDRYAGTASIQRGYGGKTVPVGGKFQTDRRTFRSVAMGGGVYECLTDECKKLIDTIAGAPENAPAAEKGAEKAEEKGGDKKGK